VVGNAALLAIRQRGRTHALLVGGGARARGEVVEQLHRASPFASGPIVRLDCSTAEPQLVSALWSWMGGDDGEHEAHPLWAAACGTLYLDEILALTAQTQRLLETFLLRREHGPSNAAGFGQLIAGCSARPEDAVHRGEFSPALFDALDKIRVEVSPSIASPLGEEEL
jgi:DNA-binding NtrC family response regulator